MQCHRVELFHVTLRLFIGTGLGGDEVTQQAFPPLPLAMSPQLSELLHTTLSVSRSGSIITISLTLGLICVASYLRWRKRVALYPPGPPPDPLLGNVRQLLKIDNQVQAFSDWERVYGSSSIVRRVVSLLICHLGQRRYQLPQRLQQVAFDPQFSFSRKGSLGEEERHLLQSSEVGHGMRYVSHRSPAPPSDLDLMDPNQDGLGRPPDSSPRRTQVPQTP